VIFTGRSELGENFTRDSRAADGRCRSRDYGGERRARRGTAPAALKAGADGGVRVAQRRASLAGSSHGRRAVFFISGGSALNRKRRRCENELKDAEVLQGDLDAIYAAAHRSDAPIYCLDPRGAVTPDTAVRVKIAKRRRPPRGRASSSYPAGASDRDLQRQPAGAPIVNAPDVGAAARELMADNGTYYVLGIRPSPLPRDGAFHEVNVQVTRPGVTVRARSGYVAPEPPERTADVSASLDRALSAGVNVTALPLRMFVTPVTASPTGHGCRRGSIEVTYPVGRQTPGRSTTTCT
jgi:VWFA-related protein